MKVGDRVEVADVWDGTNNGMKGVIKRIENDGIHAVEMDNQTGWGNTCSGMCKNGYGYWIYEKRLKLIPPELKFGDRVLVGCDIGGRVERIFLFKDPREGVDFPYYCVSEFYEEGFDKRTEYSTQAWQYCEPITKSKPKPDKRQVILDKIEALTTELKELDIKD